VPVITTASEAAGLPALDMIASERGWRVDAGSDLTRVSAALVNGEPVAVLQDCGSRDWLAAAGAARLHTIANASEAGSDDAAAIVISCRSEVALPPTLPRMIMRPPALLLGAGCSRGAPPDELIGLADAADRYVSNDPIAVLWLRVEHCSHHGRLKRARSKRVDGNPIWGPFNGEGARELNNAVVGRDPDQAGIERRGRGIIEVNRKVQRHIRSCTLSLQPLVLLRECCNDALALFLDVFCETGMALLDEARGEAELEQRDCERRRKVIEVGAHFRELYRFYRLVEELLHGVVKLVVEQFGGWGHWETSEE